MTPVKDYSRKPVLISFLACFSGRVNNVYHRDTTQLYISYRIDRWPELRALGNTNRIRLVMLVVVVLKYSFNVI